MSQSNIQELQDLNAKKENTCQTKTVRGCVHLDVVDPLDGATNSEGLASPDSFQGMVQRRDTTFKQQEWRVSIRTRQRTNRISP